MLFVFLFYSGEEYQKLLDLSTLSVPKPIRPSAQGPGLGQGLGQGQGPGYPPLYPPQGATARGIDDRNDHDNHVHPATANQQMLLSGSSMTHSQSHPHQSHPHPSEAKGASPFLPDHGAAVANANTATAAAAAAAAANAYATVDTTTTPDVGAIIHPIEGQGLGQGQELGQGQGQDQGSASAMMLSSSPLRRRNSSRLAQQQPLRR